MKHRIYNAAVALANEHGIDNVTHPMIARAANVAERTVRNYMRRQPDIKEAVMQHVMFTPELYPRVIVEVTLIRLVEGGRAAELTELAECATRLLATE